MPILGFETHGQRKSLSRAIKAADGDNNYEWATQTERLVKSYLKAERSVHCRRTLDQFLYYMLPSTEIRDLDQVIFRSARRAECEKKPRDRAKVSDRPVLMVDQLWLWVLSDGNWPHLPHYTAIQHPLGLTDNTIGNVISCFPDTGEPLQDYNLKRVVKKQLDRHDSRPVIESAEILFHQILKTALDFVRREGPLQAKFKDAYQSSINHAVRNSTGCKLTRLWRSSLTV